MADEVLSLEDRDRRAELSRGLVALIPNGRAPGALIKARSHPEGVAYKLFTEALAGAKWEQTRRVYVVTIDRLPPIVRRLRELGYDIVPSDPVRMQLEAHDAERWADQQSIRERLKLLRVELKKTGKALFRYQPPGAEFLGLRSAALLADEMGLGKESAISEPILTPFGWRAMGDLKVGDLVIGSNGLSTRVSGVFPQGIKPLFRVTMTDGAWTRAGKEHLWLVQTPNDRFRGGKGRVMTTEQILRAGLRMPVSGDRKRGNSLWFVPMVEPVVFERRDLLVNPYLLGALLANGLLTTGTTGHSGTMEQWDQLRPLLEREGVQLREIGVDWVCHLVRLTGFKNPLTRKLRALGVRVRCYDKFVPSDYLLGSIAQRIALLQGLLDNDGTVHKDGMCVEYNTTSPQLARDVLELVRSLGGSAWESTRVPSYTYKGERLQGRVDHRIRMSLPSGVEPFRVTSKAARYHPRTKYPPTHAIESIEPCGEEEAVCIRVEAEDHLYVTRDYILTHNTIQALCAIPAGAPVTIVCPSVMKRIWAKEIGLWRPGLKVRVFEGRKRWRWGEGGEAGIGNTDILPLSHEPSCPRVFDKTCEGCHPYVFGAHRPDCERGKHRCEGCRELPEPPEGTIFIVDEAHVAKNPKSLRGEILRRMTRAVRRRDGRVWALTGTPVLNRPAEAWNVLDAFDLAYEAFGSKRDFVRVMGGRPNMVEVYDKTSREKVMRQKGWVYGEPSLEAAEMLQRVMLRRLKKDVMSDLPAKMKRFIEVDVDPKAVKKADALVKELGGDLAGVSALLEGTREGVPFQLWSAARAALASAKIPAMLDLVKEYEDSKTPLVVASAHRAPIDTLTSRKGWATITGDQSSKKRAGVVASFQAGELKGVGLTIAAGGVGITLTYGSHMLFVDQDVVPGMNDQCESRVDRIGQVNAILVTVLVARHPLDARVASILNVKEGFIAASVDAAKDRTHEAGKEEEKEVGEGEEDDDDEDAEG